VTAKSRVDRAVRVARVVRAAGRVAAAAVDRPRDGRVAVVVVRAIRNSTKAVGRAAAPAVSSCQL